MKFLLLLKPVFVHYVLMCSCSCVLVHLSYSSVIMNTVAWSAVDIAIRIFQQ